MSVSETSPSVSVSSSLHLNTLSVNNVSSTNNSVLSNQTQLVARPSNSISINSPVLLQPSVEQNNVQTVSKASIASTAISSALTVTQRHIIPSTTIKTIAASVVQPAKASYGKHHLPVRPLSSFPHVAPKASTTTANASLGDPGGGLITKAVSVQPALVSAQLPSKSKAAQHILMAPGLRTATPSLKHNPNYSSTYTYHLPNQVGISSGSNNNPAINVTTTRPLLVRPITASPSSRTLVPLAIATTSEANKLVATHVRVTSVLHQPTSTISISIPARPTHQAELSSTLARVSVSSSQGRSLYQLGFSSPITSTSSSKSARIVASTQSGAVSASKSNYSVPLSTTCTATSAPSFTYATTTPRHSSIASITTSAVAVHKVVPSQSIPRIHTIHPVVSGASGNVRTNEIATTLPAHHTLASVVTSLANHKAISSQAATLQPPLMYWPQTPITINPAIYPTPSYTTGDEPATRPAFNIAVSNLPSVNESQIGQPSGASVGSNATPAFTQGQLLSSNSSGGGKEALRPTQSHHPTPPTPTHLPNLSPKPAILRKPRVDGKQTLPLSTTKKLIFDPQNNRAPVKTERRTHDGGAGDRSISKLTQPSDSYTTIKSEMVNQDAFNLPIATSNGVMPVNKHICGKDYSTYTRSPGGNKDSRLSPINRHNMNEMKIKTEPTLHHTHYKVDPGSAHVLSAPFHPTYHLPLNKPMDNVQVPTHKIPIMQPHMGLISGTVPPPYSSSLHPQVPPAPLGAIAGIPSPRLSHPRPIKSESIPPSSATKRDYDKMVTNESNHPMKGEVALSPRKKPRKQTHVVAEELPDAEQVVEDEMSTDDADECEDEVPLATLAKEPASSSRTPALSPAVPPILASSTDGKLPPGERLSEYVDADGVRYVPVRKRPPISLLNGHRLRPISNHFTHYTDVKVKDKKVNLHDPSFNHQRMRGWKVVQFAAQLEELALLDVDILHRVEAVKEGLLQHVALLMNNGKPDAGGASPTQRRPNSTPSTPCSTPSQAKGFTSYVMSLPSASNNNVNLLSSPLSSNERKTFRLRDEVLKVEEKAQANIQRCRVMKEQLSDAQTLMVTVLEQRTLVEKVVRMAREVSKHGKTIKKKKS